MIFGRSVWDVRGGFVNAKLMSMPTGDGIGGTKKN